MPVFSYFTIESPAKGLYREKGSKFLSFAYPVETESAIKLKIEALRKEYYDARHHCFAWVLGADKNKFRAFDDGEPNHSAGDPILGQIKSKDLTDVLVVVVRYFGGTKLGVGGLISAYKTSAADALNNAKIIEKEVAEVWHLHYSYPSTPEIMRLVKEFDLMIVNQKFESTCEVQVEVTNRDSKKVMERITLLQAMGVDVRLSDL